MNFLHSRWLHILFAVISVVALLIVGCGGGVSSDSPTTPDVKVRTLTGTVMIPSDLASQRASLREASSLIPAWGDRFYAEVEVLQPVLVSQEGLRAQRLYAAQIIERLAQMEEKYFAVHRERSCGFEKPAEPAKKHGFALSEENSHRY